MARSESLRERLARLQAKARGSPRKTSSLSSSSSTKTAPTPPATTKKSFFNAENTVESETALVESPENALPNMHFPGVDTSRPPTKKALMEVAARLSRAYSFPQLGVGVGTGLLSQNSKTTRISRQYPHVFVQDQLYAIFPHQHTLVDKLVSELVADARLRVLDMNFENFSFTVLVPSEQFMHTVQSSFSGSEEKLMQRYVDLLSVDPSATQVSASDLLEAGISFSTLIAKGLICMSAAAASESSVGVYNITLPHLGGLLRVVKSSCKWIAGLTDKTREHMIMASALQERWFKPYVPPKSKAASKAPDSNNNNNAFKREYYTTDRVGTAQPKQEANGPGVNIVKFRGVGLDWVLALMIGTGMLEAYISPVGVVYKATGKRL